MKIHILFLFYFSAISSEKETLATKRRLRPKRLEFKDFFDHVFFIKTDSTKTTDSLITKVNMDMISIIGINGTEVLEHPEHPMLQQISNDFKGKYAVTELGRSLSHRTAFEIISSGNYKHALILQDDADFETQSFLALVKKCRPHIKESWQIVHYLSE